MSKIEIEIAVEEAMRKHVAKYHADELQYAAELGLTRTNLVRTFDDKPSARELPTSKLAQLAAERIAELERHLKFAFDKGREVEVALIDSLRQLRIAKVLIDELRPLAERALRDYYAGSHSKDVHDARLKKWDKWRRAVDTLNATSSPALTCECGHSKDDHYDDSDGMITDGACQAGRQTGVACDCVQFRQAVKE